MAVSDESRGRTERKPRDGSRVWSDWRIPRLYSRSLNLDSRSPIAPVLGGLLRVPPRSVRPASPVPRRRIGFTIGLVRILYGLFRADTTIVRPLWRSGSERGVERAPVDGSDRVWRFVTMDDRLLWSRMCCPAPRSREAGRANPHFGARHRVRRAGASPSAYRRLIHGRSRDAHGPYGRSMA